MEDKGIKKVKKVEMEIKEKAAKIIKRNNQLIIQQITIKWEVTIS